MSTGSRDPSQPMRAHLGEQVGEAAPRDAVRVVHHEPPQQHRLAVLPRHPPQRVQSLLAAGGKYIKSCPKIYLLIVRPVSAGGGVARTLRQPGAGEHEAEGGERGEGEQPAPAQPRHHQHRQDHLRRH